MNPKFDFSIRLMELQRPTGVSAPQMESSGSNRPLAASSSHLKLSLACGDQPFKWTADTGRLFASGQRACQKIETDHYREFASWGLLQVRHHSVSRGRMNNYRFRSLENLLRWSKKRKISMCSGRMR